MKTDPKRAGLQIKGKWEEALERIKRKYGLENGDLTYEKGKEDELIGLLELKLHKNRKDIIALLNSS